MTNLFLIGYRCTGKSTIAGLVADKLAWQAVDADAYLESKYAKTIRQIFAEEGEAGFRDKEAAVLKEICQHSHQVVATGGGIILREENRTLLRQAGKCIWLIADPQTIWQRLQRDKTTTERRPNLTTGGLQEIEELLAQREPLYRASADWTVDTAEQEPEEIAEQILHRFLSWSKVEES